MAATKPVLSWHSDVSQFMEASSEEIVNYCAQPSVSAVASCQNIRRLSETLVVKFGFEVTESEYKNQLFVYDMLANKKIKVARPYRFFRAFDSYGFSNGYLVMEYVRGQRLDVNGLCNDESTIQAIATAIQCLHATSASRLTQQTSPGPLFGSVHRGFPWGDGLADGIFDTIEDLERCIQNRLRCVYRGHAARSVATTGLSDRQMVLCHLDLAPRNLLLTVDGTIAVLDWASMAWFPAAFELASLEYLQAVATADEAPFFRGVKAYLQKLSPPMEADISLLGVVHANSIRYTF